MRRSLAIVPILLAACSSADEVAPPADTDAADTATSDANDSTNDTIASDADAVFPDTTDSTIDVPADAGCTTVGRERDVWVWWAAGVVTKPAARATFFDFADAQKIRRAYVEAEVPLTAGGDTTALASLIAEAATHCVQVELLFGRPEWALAKNHATPLALAQAAIDFSAKLSGARPIAVHFDVEPYNGLPEWTSDETGTANQYLDLLEKIAAKTKGSTLKFVVDIPFWFDGHKIARGGTTRPLSEWTIDRVDWIGIMDYRDHAAAPDGMIDDAATEFAYAASVKKKLVVGAETKCITPAYITYCEEGAAKMDVELAAVRKAYAASTAFDGFAIHHYESWRALKP